jgi:hypothetical protein
MKATIQWVRDKLVDEAWGKVWAWLLAMLFASAVSAAITGAVLAPENECLTEERFRAILLESCAGCEEYGPACCWGLR